MAVELAPLCYSLSFQSSLRWTEPQERNLGTQLDDYPFRDIDLVNETPQDYVLRTYLQFLWLPESIMPLQLLVPSLKRVVRAPNASQVLDSTALSQVASTSRSLSASTSLSQPAEVHPLHELLDLVLLTIRRVNTKYAQLKVILEDESAGADPGEVVDEKAAEAEAGAANIEEQMMWYASNYEKDDEENPGSGSWRNKWIQRLERREVQIQIILYMLKLSLPGPAPVEPSEEVLPRTSKKRKLRGRDRVMPILQSANPVAPSAEECLEIFMDKLCTWQLMAEMSQGLPGTLGEGAGAGTKNSGKHKDKIKDNRDWMQIFCEDVVEPLFKTTLPLVCELLRRKVFKSPVFDVEDDEDSRTELTPFERENPFKRARSSSRALSTDRLFDSTMRASSPRAMSPIAEDSHRTRHTSPAPSITSHASSVSKTNAAHARLGSVSTVRALTRERSRSLSVSLAQEEKEKAERVRAPSKKRVLSREISMTRILKDPKMKWTANPVVPIGGGKVLRSGPPKETDEPKRRKPDDGVILVGDTPRKPKPSASFRM
ncbi:hypothetical protein FISHEDRAFT_77009 [Fistulina hepatica ATCC 64428]|uniref:DNA replication regulator Sld3 C-terminal domain-containing protein n=1 Tax=Fistulina hepatica ATCC 64428 TaxID=1128425 RepID=A0A0D7A2F3_9AGAR|nr:hypothetical protein FISHEDRAFT_77009 [Fistulina hepatica ATCC 64428]